MPAETVRGYRLISTSEGLVADFNRTASGTAAGPYLGTSASGTITLYPSGDVTGATDDATINGALANNRHVLLGTGDWYVTSVGMFRDDRWLQGHGESTRINCPIGGTAITFSNPGRNRLSHMSFIGGGRGIQVDGAYDCQFDNLFFRNQTLGGIRINGDLALEQNYIDITMRGVGGVGFDYVRTTEIYTGSLYMDRVRLVEPAANAIGFRFSSSASNPSLNTVFMNMCVADNYGDDAFIMNNCAQSFITDSWFAINGTGTNKVPVRITGGFQINFKGCYTYTGQANGPCVLVDGAPRGITIGGGHVFDGGPNASAISLTGTGGGRGVQVGEHQNFCGKFSDTPGARSLQPALPGESGLGGQETFPRLLINKNDVALPNGTIKYAYFTASKTDTITKIAAGVGQARIGGTYVGVGLFEVASNGTLKLLAKGEQTPGTLWTTGFQPPIGDGTNYGYDTQITIGTTTIYAGQRYAIGALVVGATTTPNLIGNAAGFDNASFAMPNSPLGMIGAQQAGQTTIGAVGATRAQSALAATSGVPYFVLTPS
jgi:hypothetical protein